MTPSSDSSAQNASAPSSDKNGPEQKVLPLALVLFFGLVFSVILLGGIFLLLLAYETKSWPFQEPYDPLGSDEMFGLIRNAVTAAAALGVGVTLFFSYRKQQTAERTHLLGVQAQNNAANALALATNQYQLDRERRSDQQIKDLRERFSQSAEQLGSGTYALVVAGVHSMETLADEWHRLGMDRDRQICINLLCSLVRNQAKDDPLRWPTRKLIIDTIFDHLKPDMPTERYWDAVIPLQAATPAEVSNILVKGATVDISGWTPTAHDEGILHRITLEDGYLLLHDANLEREEVFLGDSKFSGGTVSISLNDNPYEPIDYTGVATFMRCTFTGTRLVFPLGTNRAIRVKFKDCEFYSPILADSASDHPGQLEFENCRFDSDIVDRKAFTVYSDHPTTHISLVGNNNTGEFVPVSRPGQKVEAYPEPTLGLS